MLKAGKECRGPREHLPGPRHCPLPSMLLVPTLSNASFCLCIESCFLFTLTRQRLPPFCQQGYLRMQGLSSTKNLQQHGVESKLLQDYTAMEDSNRRPGDHPSAPGFLTQSLDSNKEEL